MNKNLTTSAEYLNFIPFQNVSNWSVATILRNKRLFKPGLKLEKIGNLINRSRNRVRIKDDVKYRRVTIRLYNKGVKQRDEVLGKSIGTKNQFLVSEGQFIMSKIDARNGAFGIVPKDLEQAIVTQDFLSYDINSEKILPEFFILLTYSEDFRNLCQQASSGTTGRQRIDEKAFLNFNLPIPTLPNQKEILSTYNNKLNSALAKEEIAKQSQKDIEKYLFDSLGVEIQETEKRREKILFFPFKELKTWSVKKILYSNNIDSNKFENIDFGKNKYLVNAAFRGKSPKYDALGLNYILNQKCNRWNEIDFSFVKKVNDNWYKKLNSSSFTKTGDIIINSTGEGTIGRATYITQEYSGWIYDSHILLLRLNQELVDPKYITFLLNSKFGQRQIEELKSAKSTKQTELGIQNLMKIRFPLPPLVYQKKIAHELSKQNSEIKNLLRTAKELRHKAIEEFEHAIFQIK